MNRACGTSAAILALAVLLAACTATRPTSPPDPTPTPKATRTELPAPVLSPSPSPTPAVAASLSVGGMATVHLDGVPQVVDPEHPNHDQNINDQLGTLSVGQKVFLLNQTRVKRDSYWQVVPGPNGTTGPVGWIPQLMDGELTLDPFRPSCPSTFPLSAVDLVALGGLEALSCFGNQELTLTGLVTCDRSTGEYAVGGASFLDANRWCALDGKQFIYGRVVTALLDAAGTPTVSGRYLVRGHFDDPESQNCSPIPFGTSPNSPAGPPEPGAVVACRQMFVVSNATALD